MIFELEAQTWRNVLNIDDDDAYWLLGGAYQLERHNFSKSRTRAHIGIAQNLLGSASGWPSSLVQIGQTQFGSGKIPIGPIFGLGAEPWDLKFASLGTKVRLKYQLQGSATISWNITPNLVVIADC